MSNAKAAAFLHVLNHPQGAEKVFELAQEALDLNSLALAHLR